MSFSQTNTGCKDLGISQKDCTNAQTTFSSPVESAAVHAIRNNGMLLAENRRLAAENAELKQSADLNAITDDVGKALSVLLLRDFGNEHLTAVADTVTKPMCFPRRWLKFARNKFNSKAGFKTVPYFKTLSGILKSHNERQQKAAAKATMEMTASKFRGIGSCEAESSGVGLGQVQCAMSGGSGGVLQSKEILAMTPHIQATGWRPQQLVPAQRRVLQSAASGMADAGAGFIPLCQVPGGRQLVESRGTGLGHVQCAMSGGIGGVLESKEMLAMAPYMQATGWRPSQQRRVPAQRRVVQAAASGEADAFPLCLGADVVSGNTEDALPVARSHLQSKTHKAFEGTVACDGPQRAHWRTSVDSGSGQHSGRRPLVPVLADGGGMHATAAFAHVPEAIGAMQTGGLHFTADLAATTYGGQHRAYAGGCQPLYRETAAYNGIGGVPVSAAGVCQTRRVLSTESMLPMAVSRTTMPSAMALMPTHTDTRALYGIPVAHSRVPTGVPVAYSPFHAALDQSDAMQQIPLTAMQQFGGGRQRAVEAQTTVVQSGHKRKRAEARKSDQ